MNRLIVILTAVALALGCRNDVNPIGPSGGAAVLVGAGDIALCGSVGTQATALLLDDIRGTVFTAGDNAYHSGTAEQYQNCYHPTWGRHRERTRPSPGNHEYESPRAEPYFAYFGAAAGPFGLGYYSFRLGSWHVFSLNSNVGYEANSTQLQWLRAELAANSTTCTIAYWHHPLFSSGVHGNHPFMREIWRVLYEAGADVVISAHDHDYERFALQDPDGRADSLRGIRQFIVGTGGAPLTGFFTIRPNSEVRDSSWGVLRLALRDSSYDWEFVPIAGGAFRDAGSGQCH